MMPSPGTGSARSVPAPHRTVAGHDQTRTTSDDPCQPVVAFHSRPYPWAAYR